MVAGAWGGHKNGQIPLSALTHIFGPFYLRTDVAAQLGKMLDDYVAQNPGYARPSINSAYRTLADQQYQLDHPHGQAIAAVGESTHGWGITADLSETGRNPLTHFSAWLDANAHLYGLARTIPSESWHYQGGFPATITADTGTTPLIPIIEQEDDMIVLANTETNLWAAAAQGRFDGIPSGMGGAFVKMSGHELVPVSNAEFNAARVYFMAGKEFDTKVIADVDTNAWYLLGPGVDYAIPGGQGGLFEGLYGPHLTMHTTDLQSLRAAYQGRASTFDTAGVIAAINAIPTAEENAAATRAAIIK